MKFEPVPGVPRLETTPLPVLGVASSAVSVELDDENENRVRLVFKPYQAVRMITADCYVPPGGLSVIPNVVVEVVGSNWIDELRANLREVDEGADFMEKARHYLVPLQDDFLEVIAWGVAVESVASTR
jgi:hypothetical protein